MNAPYGNKNRYEADIVIGAISDLEFGWLIGILEGEGAFSYNTTQRIQMQMTDKDVIYRFKYLIERVTRQKVTIGHYVRMEKGRENHKEVYKSSLGGAQARAVMKLIVVYMSDRRRKQIWQALNRHNPKTISLTELNSIVNTHGNVPCA